MHLHAATISIFGCNKTEISRLQLSKCI